MLVRRQKMWMEKFTRHTFYNNIQRRFKTINRVIVVWVAWRKEKISGTAMSAT